MPLRHFPIFLTICVAWELNTIVSKLVVTDMSVPPLFFAAARTLVVGALLYRYLFPMPAQILRAFVVTLLVGGAGLRANIYRLADGHTVVGRRGNSVANAADNPFCHTAAGRKSGVQALPVCC